MTQPQLRLVVIRSTDIERAVEFYRCLGVEFSEEQHGRGPRHFAATLDGVVLEIYPAKNPADVDRTTRLGFSTGDLEDRLDRIRAFGAEILQEPADSSWGRRAVLRDPDGHAVELYDGGNAASAISLPGLVRKIEETIASIYLRPQMYVGSRSETRALESVLWTMHWTWGEATGRTSEFRHVLQEILTKEECGSNNFDGTYRRKRPNPPDEEVAEYVLSCWRKISLALGIVRTPETE